MKQKVTHNKFYRYYIFKGSVIFKRLAFNRILPIYCDVLWSAWQKDIKIKQTSPLREFSKYHSIFVEISEEEAMLEIL